MPSNHAPSRSDGSAGTRQLVAVAGGAGDLGTRVIDALVRQGANVRALMRADAAADRVKRLTEIGAAVVTADIHDVDSVAAALTGAQVVVSTLNGVRDIIVDRQQILLDGAVKAGVPRFIPSDFSGDFTRLPPGNNRNLDLRREFMARADTAPIRVTSVFNGVFMDMLGAEIPMLAPRIRRIVHWGDVDQEIDFTTKDDVAAYTARVAVDDDAPRILRIAGDTVSARDLAAASSALTGHHYRTLRLGAPATLGRIASLLRRATRESDQPFPAWQGMQYARDMYAGDIKLPALDNDRYGVMTWTPVSTILRARLVTTEGQPS